MWYLVSKVQGRVIFFLNDTIQRDLCSQRERERDVYFKGLLSLLSCYYNELLSGEKKEVVKGTSRIDRQLKASSHRHDALPSSRGHLKMGRKGNRGRKIKPC